VGLPLAILVPGVSVDFTIMQGRVLQDLFLLEFTRSKKGAGRAGCSWHEGKADQQQSPSLTAAIVVGCSSVSRKKASVLGQKSPLWSYGLVPVLPSTWFIDLLCSAAV